MQILSPPAGTILGPGTKVNYLTDFVGPIEVGSSFVATITETSTEFLLGSGSNITQLTNFTIWLGINAQTTSFVSSTLTDDLGYQAWPVPATLSVELRAPNQTVLDQTSRPVVWQPNAAAVAWVQQQFSSPISGDGSFTETDRSTLLTVAANTVANFLPGGGLAQVAIAIGRLLQDPPIDVLALTDAELLLTGRGSLARPAGGVQVEAYGARVRFVVIPPGFGFRDGTVPEYETRVAQFAVMGRHGNTTTYVSKLQDDNTSGHYIRWPAPFPRRIDYDITTGCTVGWTWLSWGIQP